MTALVADDSAPNRELLARLLRRRGVRTVLTAEDGDEAVAAVAAALRGGPGAPPTPQLVVLDGEMPRMGGADAVRALRAPPLRFAGVVLGLTGGALAEDQAAFRAAGADAVLAKPAAWGVLRGTLAALGLAVGGGGGNDGGGGGAVG